MSYKDDKERWKKERIEMYRLYKDGMTINEIAVKFGVTYPAAWKRIKRGEQEATV